MKLTTILMPAFVLGLSFSAVAQEKNKNDKQNHPHEMRRDSVHAQHQSKGEFRRDSAAVKHSKAEWNHDKNEVRKDGKEFRRDSSANKHPKSEFNHDKNDKRKEEKRTEDKRKDEKRKDEKDFHHDPKKKDQVKRKEERENKQ
ncbi:hypothetical protein [Chitinophaga dinghuensis]|nr:hypothetical protein [Chitinophaga dinghuensis]